MVNEKRDKLLTKADQGDLIKFGIIPELVGRFPVVVPFHSFNKDMLIRVLTEVSSDCYIYHHYCRYMMLCCSAEELLAIANEDAVHHGQCQPRIHL